MKVVCPVMAEHHVVLVVSFLLFITVRRNTAAQELCEVTAGVQRLKVMTQTNTGDSAPAVFWVTEEIPMEIAAIFHLSMAGKCTRPALPRMKLGLGARQHTTTTLISSGAIVQVR